MSSRWKSAALPQAEVLVYWALSLGSHLFSFYHLHLFSKAHEQSLRRDFQLEQGFLGFLKDPNDFEWTFWTHWAKKSLLLSLLGHGVITTLTNIFIPKLRWPLSGAYGVVAASRVLGVKGVCVLLVHLGVTFVVAQLRRATLCWASSLVLLLLTLHLQPLQDIQRSWYDSEEEHILLLFSVAVCTLRFLSFSLEQCWSLRPTPASVQLWGLLCYTFYHPFFYNGPIVTYRDFLHRIQTPVEDLGGGAAVCRWLVLRFGRILLWWTIAEFMIHAMFMHSIQSHETYLEMLPPWALGGLALALVQFFFVKYLILFGLPSVLASMDGLKPPELPRCVSIIRTFTDMWRYFDVGLYRWLIRYVYVPLGGSRAGPLQKALSSGVAFGFVCLWHGGHDYLQLWALLNWTGVMVESGLTTALSSPSARAFFERRFSAAMQRRGVALLSACSTAMLVLSNLVFLGGIHVGRIFWKRVFVQGWSSLAPVVLFFFYCFAQIGLERTPSSA